jgi:hypothetical protein
MVRRALRCSWLVVGIATAAASARADGGGEASAQKLFDEGRELIRQGRFAEACPKFAASQELAPSGGTLLNLADCYEKNGQLASAWARFHDVASRAQKAGRTEIVEMANARIAAIEPRLSYLTIMVPAAADTEGLELRRDGEIVPRGAWGTSLPIDGGEHAIKASAPGKRTRTTSLRIAAVGERATLSLVPLESDVASTAPPADDGAKRGSGLQRPLGLAAAGAGVVALGVGVVFGLRAISKNHDAASRCPASPRCADPEGVTLTDEAKSAATISTIAFVAGGVLAAGGVTLFLTAPSSPNKAAVGAAIRGTW